MKNFEDRLAFCWDQYVKMINLYVTLTSGTLVILSSLLSKQILTNPGPSRTFGLLGLIMLFISLCSVIIWRTISQASMEKEVLGNEANLSKHAKDIGLSSSITKLNSDPVFLKKNLARIKWIYSITLLMSWIFFVITVFVMK